MNQTLTKKEISDLLDYAIDNKPLNDPYFRICVEHCEVWAYELVGINYLFAQILERRRKNGEQTEKTIHAFYDLENCMNFTAQDMDGEFIDFLFKNLSNRALSLEEKLIEIQSRLSERRYDESLPF